MITLAVYAGLIVVVRFILALTFRSAKRPLPPIDHTRITSVIEREKVKLHNTIVGAISSGVSVLIATVVLVGLIPLIDGALVPQLVPIFVGATIGSVGTHLPELLTQRRVVKSFRTDITTKV